MSFWDQLGDVAAHQARIQQIEGSLTKDWYTVAEVAELLNAHEKTVRGWIRGGQLKATRPSPRKTRIWRSDLVAYMARRGA
jgi:excisionase family DNA binding protein